MGHNTEYCDPFDLEAQDIWMKLEHCGRYTFACSYLVAAGCRSVLDLACANGYGARMLAEAGLSVSAADRNPKYLQSKYLTASKPPIASYCFDFDADPVPAQLAPVDAAVCFETIEHLKSPFSFLEKLAKLVRPKGVLLLSFPNAAYEQLNPDGSNQDTFHLHVLSLAEVKSTLVSLGFQVDAVLGQPVCNNACSRQHELQASGALDGDALRHAVRYDPASIRALSLVLAYPQERDADQSYSYLIVANKNG